MQNKESRWRFAHFLFLRFRRPPEWGRLVPSFRESHSRAYRCIRLFSTSLKQSRKTVFGMLLGSYKERGYVCLNWASIINRPYPCLSVMTNDGMIDDTLSFNSESESWLIFFTRFFWASSSSIHSSSVSVIVILVQLTRSTRVRWSIGSAQIAWHKTSQHHEKRAKQEIRITYCHNPSVKPKSTGEGLIYIIVLQPLASLTRRHHWIEYVAHSISSMHIDTRTHTYHKAIIRKWDGAEDTDSYGSLFQW